MKYTVKAIELATGAVRHITGRWDSIKAMETELRTDGYIVIWYTKD